MSRDFAHDTAYKRKTPKSAILDTQPTYQPPAQRGQMLLNRLQSWVLTLAARRDHRELYCLTPPAVTVAIRLFLVRRDLAVCFHFFCLHVEKHAPASYINWIRANVFPPPHTKILKSELVPDKSHLLSTRQVRERSSPIRSDLVLPTQVNATTNQAPRLIGPSDP
jgi:hypothetical protein